MMKVIILAIFMTFLVNSSTIAATNNDEDGNTLQEENTTTKYNSPSGVVLIPGVWLTLNYEKSSGQQYYQNEEGVIIAIAKMPKKSYSFYKPSQKNYETIEAFTKWDTEYKEQNKYKTIILVENPELEYQIWKFKDDNQIDNVFLYGGIGDYILNLLVYTDIWTETKKIEFLEETLRMNVK